MKSKHVEANIYCSNCNCLIDEIIARDNDNKCEECFDKTHCQNCNIELDICELANNECDKCYRESGGI